MELKDLQITDDLWYFIEANVPNYHEREEVLRQAHAIINLVRSLFS